MDDKTKLLLTKTRLKNLGRSKNLLELTCKKIVRNMRWFLKNEGRVQKLRNLPAILRENLLTKLTNQNFADEEKEKKELHSRIKAIKSLLCPQIKVLRLQKMMALHPELLAIIANKAPNLLSLSIGEESGNCEDLSEINRTIIPLEEIAKLTKLKKLVITSSNMVYYERLKVVCREKLKNLEYLNVNLAFENELDDEDDEDFKKSFLNLRVFLFAPFVKDSFLIPYSYSDKLWNLCVKNLPKIEVVQYFSDDASIINNSGHHVTEMPLEASSLRHLSVTPSPVELYKAFPNVTHLQVHFELIENEIETLLHFPKIRSLTLVDIVSPEIADEFLQRYGENLETLIVAAVEADLMQLSFHSLYKSCPKLKKLSLFNVGIIDENKYLQFFSELKEFDWCPNSEDKSARLSNIIIWAPFLEKLKIQYESFDVEDLKKVSSMIAGKQVLKELKTLKMCKVHEIEMEMLFKPAQFCNTISVFSEVFKNASAFLPKLVDADVDFEVVCTDWNEIEFGDFDWKLFDHRNRAQPHNEKRSRARSTPVLEEAASMTPFFVTFFLLGLSSLATATNFTQVFEWNKLDYEWPSEESRTQALKKGTYLPDNIEPHYIAVYGSRLFLSLESYGGIPVTLVSLPTSSASTAPPKLTPFPSWDMHGKIGDCDKIEEARGLEVDSVGRLWLLDSGSNTCNAKLWTIDLANNDQTRLIHEFEINHSMHDLVLDETPNGTFAYISRWREQHIVMFSLALNQSWIVHCTPGLRLTSIAMSPKDQTPRQLYLAKSKELYSFSVAALHNGTRRVYPTLIANWTGPPYRMLMDNHGTMYAAFLWENYTSSWNSSQPLQEQRFFEVARKNIYWPFTFALDQNGTIWMTVFDTIMNTGRPISQRLFKAAVGAKSYMFEAPPE
ncbi:Hypothetical predicted protein [Cloeon dipterum]|uniref:Bee-milk protein n=1 Tax=Cloeon dipterum TaxID=197152 RepID=A0A8S1DM66_9INSE|nr:Hypothetical predicted protein [Cloeon dipterum]